MVSRLTLLAGLLVVAASCRPQIGDDCVQSVDCQSTTGSRLCDTTLPGGYCTVFNCEPGTCPDDSLCVGFRSAPAPECADPQLAPRVQRNFCMRPCKDDGDCRSSYTCVDALDPRYGTVLVEDDLSRSKFCATPYDDMQPVAPGTEIPAVCRGSTGGGSTGGGSTGGGSTGGGSTGGSGGGPAGGAAG